MSGLAGVISKEINKGFRWFLQVAQDIFRHLHRPMAQPDGCTLLDWSSSNPLYRYVC